MGLLAKLDDKLARRKKLAPQQMQLPLITTNSLQSIDPRIPFRPAPPLIPTELDAAGYPNVQTVQGHVIERNDFMLSNGDFNRIQQNHLGIQQGSGSQTPAEREQAERLAGERGRAERLRAEQQGHEQREAKRQALRRMKDEQLRQEQRKEEQRVAQRKEDASSQNIRRLRQLIREKYRLDVYIWSQRNAQKFVLSIVQEEAEKSDAILQDIIFIVESWEHDVFEDKEWKVAEAIKEKLTKGETPPHIWGNLSNWFQDGSRVNRNPVFRSDSAVGK